MPSRRLQLSLYFSTLVFLHLKTCGAFIIQGRGIISHRVKKIIDRANNILLRSKNNGGHAALSIATVTLIEHMFSEYRLMKGLYKQISDASESQSEKSKWFSIFFGSFSAIFVVVAAATNGVISVSTWIDQNDIFVRFFLVVGFSVSIMHIPIALFRQQVRISQNYGALEKYAQSIESLNDSITPEISKMLFGNIGAAAKPPMIETLEDTATKIEMNIGSEA